MQRLGLVGLVILVAALAVASANIVLAQGSNPESVVPIAYVGTVQPVVSPTSGLVVSTTTPVEVEVSEGGVVTKTHLLSQAESYGPATIAGQVLSFWVGEPSCGPGWPNEWSGIMYRGGLVATQTHILYTSAWARGVRHIDNLHAPEWVVVDWASGTGFNPDFPIPGLPLKWQIVQDATAYDGTSLLYHERWFNCPSASFEPAQPMQGQPLTVTLGEANASEFSLSVEGNTYTNTMGSFVLTPTVAGPLAITATAQGLGAETARMFTMIVKPALEMALMAEPTVTSRSLVTFTVVVTNNDGRDTGVVTLFPLQQSEVHWTWVNIPSRECDANVSGTICIFVGNFPPTVTLQFSGKYGAISGVFTWIADISDGQGHPLVFDQVTQTVIPPPPVYTLYLPLVRKDPPAPTPMPTRPPIP